MLSFKQLLEYLDAPEELTGERQASRSKRVLQLIKKRKDPNTSKREVEKINRILNRMTGKRLEREMSHPAVERYYDEMRKKDDEELRNSK
jgi:hypothetical protein